MATDCSEYESLLVSISQKKTLLERGKCLMFMIILLLVQLHDMRRVMN